MLTMTSGRTHRMFMQLSVGLEIALLKATRMTPQNVKLQVAWLKVGLLIFLYNS